MQEGINHQIDNEKEVSFTLEFEIDGKKIGVLISEESSEQKVIDIFAQFDQNSKYIPVGKVTGTWEQTSSEKVFREERTDNFGMENKSIHIKELIKQTIVNIVKFGIVWKSSDYHTDGGRALYSGLLQNQTNLGIKVVKSISTLGAESYTITNLET